jgi:hypothetical protein
MVGTEGPIKPPSDLATDKDRLLNKALGEEEAIDKLAKLHGVPDYVRLQVPIRNRYDLAQMAIHLRAFADHIRALSNDLQFTDVNVWYMVQGHSYACNQAMKGSVTRNKIARDISKESRPENKIISISGGS